MSLFEKFRYYPTSLVRRAQLAAARSLITGREKWSALDRLGIHGFGTELLRVDFPPDAAAVPRWGHGRPPHERLASVLDAGAPDQLAFLRGCLAHAAGALAWPQHEDAARPAAPWQENEFLTRVDMAALFGALLHLRPTRYLEIGSGMSTRVAAEARRHGRLEMEIVSVDPEPRLAIAALCDRVERRRLEDFSAELVSLATPRTVVFFDGSHRCFPASDVTVFFLELLPALPPGCVVHIHDIYLPYDYPAAAFNRLWSDQYLLASWLLGGAAGMKILLPCARMAQRSAGEVELRAALGPGPLGGSSFWLQKT